ncbi:MAG TPA: hypothetical protein VGR47_15745 [Terracidiphilus sp.]|nr:hypothetical protein [Terracidiphilus sp.]
MSPKTNVMARNRRRAVKPDVSRTRRRTKLSTTVAPENFAFLEAMVGSGRAESIADAVDLALSRYRQLENRIRLDHATTAYFEALSPRAQAEERALTDCFAATNGDLDFDLEP